MFLRRRIIRLLLNVPVAADRKDAANRTDTAQKLEKTMNRIDEAERFFRSGYNCTQAVLSSQLPESPLDLDTVLRLATGMGAGMGRTMRTCGAVTGALMILGLRHGRGTGDEVEAQNECYARVRRFLERFSSIHGSTECRELLEHIDLSTPEGQSAFRDRGYRDRCAGFVRSAVELLEEE